MKKFKIVPFVVLLGLAMACEHSNVDPETQLDQMFIPSGYEQAEPVTDEASAYLKELQLKNPTDHFYYLKLTDGSTADFKKVMFPQKELKIEYVDGSQQGHTYNGVIVKRITGKFEDEHFTVVDNQPAPVGGMKALYDYIKQNLKYPAQARKMGIEGRVFVQFTVDKTGALTDVKTVKGIGAGCDEAAVQVLKNAPQWNPGKVNGESVGVRLILPVSFKLD